MKPPEDSGLAVVLHSFQGGWGVASLSPFCLKSDAMLRLAGVPFEIREPSGPPKTKTGKLPALEPTPGHFVEGSDAIADWLRDARGIDLDQGLSDSDRAQALLLRRTIEEHLYFHIAHERWVGDAGFRMAMPAYFGHLPPVLRDLAPLMLRGTVKKAVRGQGVGRMSAERRAVRVEEDLCAVSAVLGDRDWFFADRPTSTDVVVFGFVGNVLAHPEDTPLKVAVQAHASLVAHTTRLKALLYEA